MLVDPVIIKPYDTKEHGLADHRTGGLIHSALNRRDSWPSKHVHSASIVTHIPA
jgi:hypothetical protein